MKYINEQGDVDLMPTGLEQDAQTQRDDGFFFEDFSGGTVTYRKIFFKILKNICKNLTPQNWGAVCKGNCVAGALRPADVLIVYSMDRLSRDTADTLALGKFFQNHEIEVVTLQGMGFGTVDPELRQIPAEQKAMTSFTATTRELYKNFVSDRTRKSYNHITGEQKKWWGKIPSGFKKIEHGENQGKITPKNPTTIAIIKYMLQGYNSHEISRLHLVDEDGNKWDYPSKVWHLKNTLQKRGERIVLPDELYNVKKQPVKVNGKLRIHRALWTVHAQSPASSLSSDEYEQDPNPVPSSQKTQAQEQKFWKKVQEGSPEYQVLINQEKRKEEENPQDEVEVEQKVAVDQDSDEEELEFGLGW